MNWLFKVTFLGIFVLKSFQKNNTDFLAFVQLHLSYTPFSDYGPLWNLGGTLREEKFTPGLVKVGVVVTLLFIV